jgi:hypothetical protein
MKKLIFAVLVVLLATLAVTCDSAIFPGKLTSGEPAPPPGEPEYVTISINVEDLNSRSRAMNETQNRPSVNFYEAVFVYNEGGASTKTTRSTYKSGDPTWMVTIPKVSYKATPNKAILFAGIGDTDSTLVAIGNVTSGGDFTVTDTTITFTLSAIYTPENHYSGGTLATSPADVESLTSVPVYEFQKGTTGISASFKLNISRGDMALVVSHSPPATTVNVASVGSTTPAAITVSAFSPATNAFLTNGENTFSFTITPNSTAGFNKIYMDVPVIAINNLSTGTDSKSVVIWHVRGGKSNSTLDTGDNDGGAVLLQVMEEIPKIVSITSSGTGWTSATNIWTYTIGTGATGDIVITASATSPTGYAPTFTWQTVNGANPALGDPLATNTFGGETKVDGTNNNTLTIPYADLDKKAAGTYRVYAIGNKGSDDVFSTNVISVVSAGAEEGNYEIIQEWP